MSFEPQKFFIGLVDFFAVLLPGAVLTWFLAEPLRLQLVGPGFAGLTPTQQALVFLLGAYLAGHFVFLLGSWLLDDHFYDWLRQGTDGSQARRLAQGQPLDSAFRRRLATWLIKGDMDTALRQVHALKQRYLDPLRAGDAINAFQWAKARLTLEHPGALTAVQRFEANSKFFRSLVVVLLILGGRGALLRDRALLTTAAALLVPALWRYVDQRVKAIAQACWFLITLEADPERRSQLGAAPAGGPTHAGGVVGRRGPRGIEFLLVEASTRPGEWVLPKGHIEPGESRAAAAIREVHEESGVWAAVRQPLGQLAYQVEGDAVTVQFYLMDLVRQERSKEPHRRHQWVAPEEALARLPYEETRELIRLAAREHPRPEIAPVSRTA